MSAGLSLMLSAVEEGLGTRAFELDLLRWDADDLVETIVLASPSSGGGRAYLVIAWPPSATLSSSIGARREGSGLELRLDALLEEERRLLEEEVLTMLPVSSGGGLLGVDRECLEPVELLEPLEDATEAASSSNPSSSSPAFLAAGGAAGLLVLKGTSDAEKMESSSLSSKKNSSSSSSYFAGGFFPATTFFGPLTVAFETTEDVSLPCDDARLDASSSLPERSELRLAFGFGRDLEPAEETELLAMERASERSDLTLPVSENASLRLALGRDFEDAERELTVLSVSSDMSSSSVSESSSYAGLRDEDGADLAGGAERRVEERLPTLEGMVKGFAVQSKVSFENLSICLREGGLQEEGESGSSRRKLFYRETDEKICQCSTTRFYLSITSHPAED